MKRSINLLPLLAAMLFLTAFCAAQSLAAAPMNYSQYGRPPVPAGIVLLLPEEFERFTYVGAERGPISYPIGPEAVRELRMALGTEFASVEVWPVRSEAEARALLSPDSPGYEEVRSYDFAVIPRFTRVGSSYANQKYGFDVDLVADFYSTDGATVTSIKGKGESSTGKYAPSSPQEGAELALQYAVSAILDGVEGRRDIFAR